MPINSRRKGKTGELELCVTLRTMFGWSARRSAQYCGDAGDSDVIVEEHPGLFVECKRVQALNLEKAMSLAKEQAKGKLPIVCHRKDRSEWLVTCRMEDLLKLAAMLGSSTQPGPSDPTSGHGLISFPPPESAA